MIWESVYSAVKGVGDTIVNTIKEFHLEPAEAIRLEQITRQAHMDFERQLWDLERQDRDSARKREISLNDPTTRRLAYLYTGGYFGIFLSLISGWFTVQPDIKQLVDVLMAVLTAGQYSILTYYFGSSHGSASKDVMIAQGSASKDVTIDRVVNHK